MIWPAEPLSANVYGAGFPGREPADIPAEFWPKIELAYPDGTVRTIVNEREPADDRELPELMLRVQLAAGQYGFRVTVIGADGTRTYAPAMVA